MKDNQIKYCRKCQVQLIVGENWLEYRANKSDRICNECEKINAKKYREHNKIKTALYNKEYRENNKEALKEYNKEYCEENKEKLKRHKKKYCEENKQEIAIYKKEYYEDNKEKIKYNSKLYYEENKEKMKEYSRQHRSKPETKHRNNERSKTRRQTDLNYKMACYLRNRMNMAIRNGQKAGSAVTDLGISIETFNMYIEAQFEDGMTWENHGTLWHIDHIKPLCEFDLTDREQFLEAANWMNQRPLWKKDNLKKISEDKKKSIYNKS